MVNASWYDHWHSWSSAQPTVVAMDPLTVMTGGTSVTCVTAVAIEGRPGLGASSFMLTIVWQTPNQRKGKAK